jgi:hypothetical protein
MDELSEMECGGVSCAVERWDTEGVWLDRGEAEAFGHAKHYRYQDGWRVYGMPAYGELAKLLRGETRVQPAALSVIEANPRKE